MEMYNDDDFDDILPEARIFDTRVDDIWNENTKAQKELRVSSENESAESETNDVEIVKKIQKSEKNCKNKKGRPKRNTKRNKKPNSDDEYDKDVSPPSPKKALRRTTRKQTESSPNKTPEVKLSKQAMNRLKKLELKTLKDSERIEKETRQFLATVNVTPTQKRIDVELVDDDIPEQEMFLKIRYLSKIHKVAVSDREAFKSIFQKVADILELKPTEFLLCLEDSNIALSDTPHSLKLKFFQIIDCIPYKPQEHNLNKLLIKIQSNDSRKKTEMYIHKLEKFEEVMKKYADMRKLLLKDIQFEFDGEIIEGSETPMDLDMESGVCIDVKILNFKANISEKATEINFPDPIPRNEMLDICVLD